MNDRSWELIQMLLDADVSGAPARPRVSTRTLFGIKSTVERVVDSAAAEMDARCTSKRCGADTRGKEAPCAGE